jgi:hypothetical protein
MIVGSSPSAKEDYGKRDAVLRKWMRTWVNRQIHDTATIGFTAERHPFSSSSFVTNDESYHSLPSFFGATTTEDKEMGSRIVGRPLASWSHLSLFAS